MTQTAYAYGVAAKYQQIAKALRARIVSGEFAVDEKLPTGDALCEEYDAAGGTIDNALRVLNKEGIAETIHGSGTFVRDPAPRRSLEFLDLERQLEAAVARLDAGEARQEATEGVVRELYAKSGLDQPSHQQDGRDARHEDAI